MRWLSNRMGHVGELVLVGQLPGCTLLVTIQPTAR